MNGFDFIENNFRQDQQDFLDIYYYFFPDERNKGQSASRKRYYDLQLSIIRESAPSVVYMAYIRRQAMVYSRFLQETVK